ERRAEAAHVVMADAEQRQTGQGAVLDILIELTLPLVVAPQVRVVLVVAAEIEVRLRHQPRVEWRDLDRTSRERVLDLVAGAGCGSRGANAADVVHQEAVVAYGQAGVQHRVEDIAFLRSKGRVRRRMVGGTGQKVGGAAGKERRDDTVLPIR